MKTTRFASGKEFKIINRNPLILSLDGCYAIRIFSENLDVLDCYKCPFGSGQTGCGLTYWRRQNDIRLLTCVCGFGLSDNSNIPGMRKLNNQLFLKNEEEI